MLNLISADLSKGMIADIICLAIIALFAISNLSKGFFKQLFVVDILAPLLQKTCLFLL